MASTFIMVMQLKGQQKGAESVYYKNDGRRFPSPSGQADTVTVKLKVNTPYTFTVRFRPAKVLTHWMIGGEKVKFDRVSPQKAEEHDVSIYTASWTSTGLTVSKKADRFTLHQELEIHPGVVMKTALLIKSYAAEETGHTTWGSEVHSLEYTCKVPESSMCVEITHEKIL